jgi:arylsulfatase A-like enzyme
MNKATIRISLLILLYLSSLPIFSYGQKADDLRTLVVIFDGLREDYITPELMPNLHALGKSGGFGRQNHSVFPTVTRVNSPSFATGSYPQSHGILGNSIFIPGLNPVRVINTGNARELMEAADATAGKLVTSVSLGEVLQAHGKRMMVFSSGSTGQAYLQNHTVVSGAIINPDLILPASFKAEVVAAVGEAPAAAKPNKARHQWIIDAFEHFVLKPGGPEVSTIWFSDPDGTAHAEGIGAPLTIEAIKIVDQQLGRLLKTMEARKLKDKFNILVTTDHGFVTHTGKENISDFLISQGLKASRESEDVIIAGGAIYVKDHDARKIEQIVTALQAQEWIGALFTKAQKPGDVQGWVKGTLSFESIFWNHTDRVADILADVNWSDHKNEFGYEGSSTARGTAGHGSSSPYEIHIPLVFSGPSFKKGADLQLPTSNVDITPTVLHLHQISVPDAMSWRVMKELLKNSPPPQEKPKKVLLETTVRHQWGEYKLTLQKTVYDNHSYVDYTKVTRNYSVNQTVTN